MSPDCYPPVPISQQLHGGDQPESENQRRRDSHSAPGLSSRARARRLRVGRCLRALAAWKAPHVQEPRSRLRRFPAMNWASESESPARLWAQCTAPGAGDGCPPNSAGTARVRARRPPAKHPGAWLGALGCGLSAGCLSRGSERLSVLATGRTAESRLKSPSASEFRAPPPRG